MKSFNIPTAVSFLILTLTANAIPTDKCLNFRQVCTVFNKVIVKDIAPDAFLNEQAFLCVLRKSFDYIHRKPCIKNKSLQDFMLAQQPDCQRQFEPCITKQDALTQLQNIIDNAPGNMSSGQKKCLRNKVMALEFSENGGKCTKEQDVFVVFNLGIGGECPM